MHSYANEFQHNFSPKSHPLLNSTNNLLLEKNSLHYFDTLLKTTDISTTNGSSFESNKYAIKLNVLAVTGVISPSFEIKLTNNFSFQLQFLGVYQPQGFIGTNKPLSLFELFIEPRYYPMETFRGFFVGLNAGIGYFDMARQIIPNYWMEDFDNVYHKGWNVIGGLSLGWTFNLGTNLALEPFITTGYTFTQYDNYVYDKLTTPDHTGSRFVYAYNGGINVVYKIGEQSNYLKVRPVSRQYQGSKYNKRFYRKYKKIRMR